MDVTGESPFSQARRPRGRQRRVAWRAALATALWARTPELGPPDTPRSRAQTLGRHAVPIALYGAIALAMTWPLARDFTTRLPGNNFDALQNYWNFWWLREALSTGRNPFETPLLYAPYGAPLYLHTFNLFNGLVTLPVQLLRGPAAAYNTAVLLSFILSGYFANLLVSHVTGDRLAGFTAGALYAFSGFHLGHFYFGQTNLLASEWLPAFALALSVAMRHRGRRRTLTVLAGAGALFLATLVDWQYALFGLFFLALYSFWHAVARRSLVPLAVAAAMGLAWLALAGPLLAATIAEVRAAGAPLAGERFVAHYSADLVSFFIPSTRQRWWSAITGEQGPWWNASLAFDRAAAPGFAVIVLALVGVWYGARRARFWLVGAALFALLALGPLLQVGGVARFGVRQLPIRLPYRLLMLAPGINIARVPSRFLLLTLLCLIVLAGFAVAGLLAGRRTRAGQLALVALVLTAGLGEQFAAPFPAQALAVSPFYAALGASTEPGAVLDLPLYYQNPRALYYQTIHHRPIVAGYLSRDLPYPLADLPPYATLLGHPAEPDITSPDPPDLPARALTFANVRWVVIQRDLARFDRPPLADFLARWVESAPLYSDERIVVYRPRAVADRDAPAFAARPGAGWEPPEPLAGSATKMRWFARGANLNIWSLGARASGTTLRFDAWSLHRPRRLQLLLDGAVIGEWRVAERRAIEVRLQLAPGQHRLELRSLDSPERPVDLGVGADTRWLAIAVTAIEFR